MRDVVQQARNLLATVGSQTPEQQVNTQAVLEPRDGLEWEREGGRTRLTDSLEPLERWARDQGEQFRVVHRHVAVNPVSPPHQTPALVANLVPIILYTIIGGSDGFCKRAGE